MCVVVVALQATLRGGCCVMTGNASLLADGFKAAGAGLLAVLIDQPEQV